jgi:two-component system nitrate/nitrite response regulator NarL
MRKQPRASGGLMDVLTVREREVIQLVVTGASTKELSRRLGISQGTTKVHLHNIYEKLGISKRSDLIAGSYAVPNVGRGGLK